MVVAGFEVATNARTAITLIPNGKYRWPRLTRPPARIEINGHQTVSAESRIDISRPPNPSI